MPLLLIESYSLNLGHYFKIRLWCLWVLWKAYCKRAGRIFYRNKPFLFNTTKVIKVCNDMRMTNNRIVIIRCTTAISQHANTFFAALTTLQNKGTKLIYIGHKICWLPCIDQRKNSELRQTKSRPRKAPYLWSTDPCLHSWIPCGEAQVRSHGRDIEQN